MYVCGVTPYDEPHLGHARCYVVFDVLRRTFEFKGYRVKHIQNFTDVDDKIIDRAHQNKEDPLHYPERFIKSYFQWMSLLNVKSADQYPRVTQNMPVILNLIKKLIKNGLAYEVEGTVYYSVRKFPSYGKLSNRNVDELKKGARVEVDERKKDPLDFALWKRAKEREPSWDSPWGKGRPGWHIECSALSMQALGEEFDIHGGGLDLIFPHHENEIAQSEGATNKTFARYWIHNGFVTLNEEKMSKSLGNFFSLKDILAHTDPMVVRYFLLSQHYRSPLNYSDSDLEQARSAWFDRMVGSYRIAAEHSFQSKGLNKLDKDLETKLEALRVAFDDSLSDDLNTASALGVLNQLGTFIFELDKNKSNNFSKSTWKKIKESFDEMANVLGLMMPAEEKWDDEIYKLVKEREQARQDKEWKKSDQIRDALKKKGVLVVDSSAGPRLKRLK